MNKFPDPLEDALAALYQQVQPAPSFTNQLEQQLLALESSPQERSLIKNRFKPGLMTAAWIAAAVLALLFFTWAINNLIARPAPASLQTISATTTKPQESPTTSPAKPESPLSRNPVRYKVKPGDTLSSITKKTGMPVEIILALNDLEDGDELVPGIELVIGFETPKPPSSKEKLTLEPLSVDSSSEEIRRCLRSSAATWHTLWADALLTSYSKGEQHIDREQAWLQEGASRWLSGASSTQPSLLWIDRDGKSALVDLQSGESQQMVLSGRIPSQLEDLLLPGVFASRGGEFRPFMADAIADREAVAIEWIDDDKRLMDRFWIDSGRCVILKWVHMPKEYADSSGKIVLSEVMITNIVFDGQFPPTMFDLAAPYPVDFAADFDAP